MQYIEGDHWHSFQFNCVIGNRLTYIMVLPISEIRDIPRVLVVVGVCQSWRRCHDDTAGVLDAEQEAPGGDQTAVRTRAWVLYGWVGLGGSHTVKVREVGHRDESQLLS